MSQKKDFFDHLSGLSVLDTEEAAALYLGISELVEEVESSAEAVSLSIQRCCGEALLGVGQLKEHVGICGIFVLVMMY